jgi:DNA-binding XRE family transcriptional regulator
MGEFAHGGFVPTQVWNGLLLHIVGVPVACRFFREASMKANLGVAGPAAQHLIGLAIRRFREREDLTLEQLARRAGISYQYLCGIEKGRENFSIGILEKVSAALGLPLATLVAVAYGEAASVGFSRPLVLAEPIAA